MAAAPHQLHPHTCFHRIPHRGSARSIGELPQPDPSLSAIGFFVSEAALLVGARTALVSVVHVPVSEDVPMVGRACTSSLSFVRLGHLTQCGTPNAVPYEHHHYGRFVPGEVSGRHR